MLTGALVLAVIGVSQKPRLVSIMHMDISQGQHIWRKKVEFTTKLS